MAERHDPNHLVGAAPDVAPLAWVIDEIRNSLTEAVNGLKAFLANKQDVDSLRNARSQVHQANGALQLLDLRGVALVTESVEQLTRRFEAEPRECLPAAVRSVETALTAVVAYLEALLSGRPNQPIRLFPYYREVLQLNRAGRVHPADLIFPDLSRRPAFHEIEARQYPPDQLRDRRARFKVRLFDPDQPEGVFFEFALLRAEPLPDGTVGYRLTQEAIEIHLSLLAHDPLTATQVSEIIVGEFLKRGLYGSCGVCGRTDENQQYSSCRSDPAAYGGSAPRHPQGHVA